MDKRPGVLLKFLLSRCLETITIHKPPNPRTHQEQNPHQIISQNPDPITINCSQLTAQETHQNQQPDRRKPTLTNLKITHQIDLAKDGSIDHEQAEGGFDGDEEKAKERKGSIVYCHCS